MIETKNYIPARRVGFVPGPHFHLIKTFLGSKEFCTLYLSGPSGTGKTETVLQICAEHSTPLFRVNLTAETTERDLIGGWVLENGATVWKDSLVIEAMKAGGVLLLDEIDLASSKILALQSILEGSPYINKQTQEVVVPALGFKIVATANTKGSISSRSSAVKFVGAQTQNEAMLDRFDAWFDFKYPSEADQFEILCAFGMNQLRRNSPFEAAMEQFARKLAAWGARIQKAEASGQISETVSLRRLKSCMKTFLLISEVYDKETEEGEYERVAVDLAITRFPESIQTAFREFWKML